MKEETCCTIYQYNCDIIVGYFSLQINCIVDSSSPSIGQLLLICVSNQNSQCPFLHFIQGKAYLPGSCSIKQESTNTSAETSLFLQMSEFLLANYMLKKFVGGTFMPKKAEKLCRKTHNWYAVIGWQVCVLQTATVCCTSKYCNSTFKDFQFCFFCYAQPFQFIVFKNPMSSHKCGKIGIIRTSVAPIWAFTDIPIVRYIQADIGLYR